MNNINQLLSKMTELETPLNESKFLGHSHKHRVSETEKTDDAKVESKEETPDIEKIKESLMKAYEDYISSKSNVDKSLQEKSKDKCDYSFTVKVKDKKEPITVNSDDADSFAKKLIKVTDNPRFESLLDYSYPQDQLSEGSTSQNVIPCALRLAPLLKPETRTEAFAAIDELRDKLTVDEIKQVWRLAKIFRNSKKPPVDPVDEATMPTTTPITPVAPVSATNTTQTTQNNQQTGQQNTQNTNQQPNQQNTQQNNQKPPTQTPPTTTAKDAITTMLDTIKKNPAAIDTLKKGIANLPQ